MCAVTFSEGETMVWGYFSGVRFGKLIASQIFWLNMHKTPTDTFLNLLRGLCRRVKAVIATKDAQLHINIHGFVTECPTSSYRCNGHMSTYFWTYGVYLCMFCFIHYILPLWLKVKITLWLSNKKFTLNAECKLCNECWSIQGQGDMSQTTKELCIG